MMRQVVPIPKAAVVAHAKENLGAQECMAKLTEGDAAKVNEIVKASRQFRFNDMPCATMGEKCWDSSVRG